MKMKTVNKALTTLVIGSAIVTGGTLATAAFAADDDPLLKAIEARKGLMKNYSFNAGPLFGMAKGKMDYNAEMAAAAANNLKLLSMMDQGPLWPEGSDNEAYPDDTRALKEAWTTYPKVAEKGEAFDKAAAELAAAAGDGLDALKSKIGDLGKSCKGCHDDFRAEKE